MYQKILIPLDGSMESEGVFALVQDELAPGGEMILLQVIRPSRAGGFWGYFDLETQYVPPANYYAVTTGLIEGEERSKAKGYLTGVARRLEGEEFPWRCEVEVAETVSQGIVNFALREGVDVIAMYTHDRKGLARLIKGSIARDVERKASIEVKVFKPRELVGVA